MKLYTIRNKFSGTLLRDNYGDIRIFQSAVAAGDVSKYKYTLNFNPDMWIPYEAEVID